LSFVEINARQLKGRPNAALRAIGLRLGEVSGVQRDSLDFCFECLVKETALEHVQLKIEICPLRHRCRTCGNDAMPVDGLVCPACGSSDFAFDGGDELDVAYLELEET
jgi:hydrogenase nickel incorporation protein HypA/HybF